MRPLRLLCTLLVFALAGVGALAQPTQSEIALLPELTGDLLERDDLRRIAEFQNARDTVGLLRHLDDADPSIRARVAFAFGSIRSPVAVPALYPMLDDDDPSVRAFAAFAIGQSGQVMAPPVLIDALHRETDHTVLTQIMHALGRVGDRPALAALVTADIPARLEPERAIAIARFGIRGVHDTGAIRHLVNGLTSDDDVLRRNAAYYFGRMTETQPWSMVADSVISIAVGLADGDEAHLFLTTALGRLRTPPAEDYLLNRLSNGGDWRVRVNAARALGGWGSVEALIESLYDSSHHVATAAAMSLATADGLSEGQLDRLESWIHTNAREWQVWTAFLPVFATGGRTHVITDAIFQLFPLASLPAMLRALGRDTTDDGWRAIIYGLQHRDARVAAGAVDALRQRWDAGNAPLSPRGYVDLIATALRRGEGAVVVAAAPALGDSLLMALGGGEVLREVYADLKDGRSVGAMDQIIRAHGAARDTAALDFLIGQAVEARHPILRQAAVETLTQRFGERFHFSTLGGGPPRFPDLDWDYLQSLGTSPRLIFETERGTIVLELLTEWAPATVQAIARFASEGQYDGVPFHRVVPNFVIQGGDFNPGDGFGGPDFYLPSEFTPLPYLTGTLGMASSGPDTEGSQFFVTHSMQPHLTGNYTVFGRVVEGQDVVNAIRADDTVIRARIEPTP